jgi:signal transduction histidine kinase
MNNTSYGNTVISIPYYGDDELGLLCRNFEEMGKRLKKSEKEEIELIQAISHDLKTPMTSIIGYMNRLINGKANSEEKRKEYYEIVYRKANEMKLLLNDLEEYASIGIEIKYDMQPVDVSKFIVDICEEIRCEVEERSGSFKCLNSIDEAFEMLVDEVKIRRVFTNIVENSFKYAGENCELSIRTSLKEKFILFEICDNGIGVPEEQLGKIFDRFYRTEVSRSRERGGTGLGLAICKSIVEGHGGKICAKQNAGGGLCISFTIPVRKVSK